MGAHSDLQLKGFKGNLGFLEHLLCATFLSSHLILSATPQDGVYPLFTFEETEALPATQSQE